MALCALSLTGCTFNWEGGFQVIPEETDDEMITYRYDPVIVDMKKMKRQANEYCKSKGFRKADTAAVQSRFLGISDIVYECER
ncbi:Uncharacterised protein [Budvicia aquatica]|nr:Uncharacterised protein [Budvicia aquatica]